VSSRLRGPLCLALAAALLAGAGAGAEGLWIPPSRLAALPTSGAAWDQLRATADRPAGTPDLSNKKDPVNVRVLAKALVHARTGEEHYRQQVIRACRAAIGSEGDATLALGRELLAYVIAADLVGLPPELDRDFRSWLRAVRERRLGGRTLISTHEDRPNNWGAHAGASRMAVAVYLGDGADLARAATVLRGYLGDRAAYHGFRYGELWWQADPLAPVGVNPAGASRQGHSIDGVLPDDQRRDGPFRWPPPRENYAYEALQGLLAQAVILHNAGYDVWSWQDRALLRAFRWLHEQADFPARGDDTWQPHVVNFYYGTSFPAPVPARAGKNVGWTDWTHGPAARAPKAAPSGRAAPHSSGSIASTSSEITTGYGWQTR
jgi:hypothetical protein